MYYVCTAKLYAHQIPIQVNLCQKHLFSHQLTHNMTKYCSLIYQFSTWKLQAEDMLSTKIVFLYSFWHSEQFMYTTCSELVVFMYWTGKSMNNILSYCGLVDVRINASDKNLPVQNPMTIHTLFLWMFCNLYLRILKNSKLILKNPLHQMKTEKSG